MGLSTSALAVGFCGRSIIGSKLFRESTKTQNRTDAEKFLRARVEQAKRPEFVGPKENKLTLDDFEKKLEADYIRHERRSWKTAQFCLRAVKKVFQHDRLLDITPQRIEQYQQDRLDQGLARATVNREVRYLLHGFKLLYDAGQISYVPRVKLLEGENVREGFLNRPEFNALCEHLDEDNRDIVKFLYLSAWRSGEAMTLTWDKVDLNDWVIRLSRKNDKTKRPRVLTLVGELADIINRRQAKRLPSCPFVFHRRGQGIKSIRRQWQTAAGAVGLGSFDEAKNYSRITPHDMRRSAVRNISRPESRRRSACPSPATRRTRHISATASLMRMCNASSGARPITSEELEARKLVAMKGVVMASLALLR